MDIEDPDYVARNRRVWNVGTGLRGRGRRRRGPPMSQPGGLCGAGCRAGAAVSVDGLDVIELGCGTAYVSAWLARRGARPVGIDNSPAQLETARRLQREHGLGVSAPPRQRRGDPVPGRQLRPGDQRVRRRPVVRSLYAWIPEARASFARGRADLPGPTACSRMLCVPETDAEGPANATAPAALLRDAPPATGRTIGVEFDLGYGDWIRVLRANDLEWNSTSSRCGPGPERRRGFAISSPPQWARQRPSEEIWKAHKR